MTVNVISTTDLNLFIKEKYPSLYLNVNDLKSMGFEPLFKTATGTYWNPSIVELVENKLKELDFSSKQQSVKPTQKTFEQGYQAGYKARSKKQWQSVTDNEAKDLIQGAFANDEYIMDIGWLLHSFEQLLKAKNHG